MLSPVSYPSQLGDGHSRVRIIPVSDEYIDMNMFETYFVLRLKYSRLIYVDLKVEGKPLKMELDTGSAVSIIPSVWHYICTCYLAAYHRSSTGRNIWHKLYPRRYDHHGQG